MRLADRGGIIVLTDRGIPPFPAELERRYELTQMAGDEANARREFFEWYANQCHIRGIYYPRTGTPEDSIHLARLLGRHDLATLKRLTVEFFMEEGERLRDGYHHHLRLFVAREPQLVLDASTIKRTEIT